MSPELARDAVKYAKTADAIEGGDVMTRIERQREVATNFMEFCFWGGFTAGTIMTVAFFIVIVLLQVIFGFRFV